MLKRIRDREAPICRKGFAVALLRTALTQVEPKSLLEVVDKGQGNTKTPARDRAPISALSAVDDPPRDRNSQSPDHNRTLTRRKQSTAETSLNTRNTRGFAG